MPSLAPSFEAAKTNSLTNGKTRKLIRDRFANAIVLSSERDIDRYEDTISQFGGDDDRVALFESLFLLGLPAAQIRWHAEHRGEQRMAVAAGD